MNEIPLKSSATEPGGVEPGDAQYESLRAAYRAQFGVWPPVMFMPEALAIALMEDALKTGEALVPEAFPGSGCSCA